MAEKLQTISEISRHILRMLRESQPAEEAGALATAIIMEYTGMGRAAQLAFGDRVAGDTAAERIIEAAVRAAAGEPLQYIFGYPEFCGHRIEVGPGVLIPRPETEEMTLMIIRGHGGFRGTITDLCTGTGCIAIALALAFPGASVTATDLSAAALEMAQRNITRTGAAVRLMKDDLLSDSHHDLPASNLIVSNPPYVTMSEKRAMQRNVLDHEPHDALFVPDDDPLLYYRAVAGVAEHHLLPGGTLWLEVNEGLAHETAALYPQPNYSRVSILRDIRGKERFIKAEKNG
ncbi:MAG: peptide chain release factor N(5)-glutamine methyltransferase [Bacteroidales bacterium]|nr:peptide chain release factor N(5)-glutamine methyltransferase [Bacteroidales bacterium]